MLAIPVAVCHPAFPDSRPERWLRRLGDGLHRGADALRRWRQRRHERHAQRLFDSLPPSLRADLGVADLVDWGADRRPLASWREPWPLYDAGVNDLPRWRQ